MYREAVADGLSTAQLEAARLGFTQVLRRKGMSRKFVEREGEDLLAQAFFEYSRQLARGEEIRDPVAWILVCAWHRTVSLLEGRDRRPRQVSTERLGELAAAGVEGSPEEEFLTEDRLRKVRKAVERLPDYQRRLLALSYFEGESVREAARRLGWTPSKAQRAHESAQRRLHRHLGVETGDELTVIGLAAFLSLKLRGRPIPHLLGGVEGVLDSVARHSSHLGEQAWGFARHPFGGGAGPIHLARSAGRRASDLARRLPPNGVDATTGLASTGGGERLVEACKVAAAACVIGGGAIGGAALLAPHHPHHRRRPDPPPARTAAVRHPAPRHVSAPTATQVVPVARAPEPAGTEPAPRGSAGRAGGGRAASVHSSATPKETPAARQAERHVTEEASAEEEWGGVAKATQEAETEAGSEPASSSATTDSEETTSGAAAGGSPKPMSAKQKTEEQTTQEQFREGLP